MMFALGVIVGLLLAIFDFLLRKSKLIDKPTQIIGAYFDPKGEVIHLKNPLEEVMEEQA